MSQNPTAGKTLKLELTLDADAPTTALTAAGWQPRLLSKRSLDEG